MAVTRQSLLDEIRASIDHQSAYAMAARPDANNYFSPGRQYSESAAYRENEKRR